VPLITRREISRCGRDSLIALQRSFTGIDNQEPDRIAAYKALEQNVSFLAAHIFNRCSVLYLHRS
jgi:hypothetical protein